jgi:hypothetical protein
MVGATRSAGVVSPEWVTCHPNRVNETPNPLESIINSEREGFELAA